MSTGIEAKVLEYLQTHRYMTVLSCIKHLHTTELRTYVARLRKKGYKITDVWKKNKYGEYKAYSLVKEKQSKCHLKTT